MPKKQKIRPDEGVEGKASPRLYTLVVYLSGGPVSDEFEGKIIFRTIQVRGDQTLEGLHKTIFEAYDRFDEHLYEFMFGAGPDDRSAIYSLPIHLDFPEMEEETNGDVRTTTLDSLGLEVGRVFGYRFDFGDEWLHEIEVTAIEDYSSKGKYPKITKKVGKSPPQYIYENDE
jgi:hypothetical protein